MSWTIWSSNKGSGSSSMRFPVLCILGEATAGSGSSRTRLALVERAPSQRVCPPLGRAGKVTLKGGRIYSAACCATVGSEPATVARRMSRGCD
jgi:hypothetical protein